LGPVNHPGLLTQVVPASAGPHTISFWVSNSGQPSEFEVWWEGQKIHEVKTVPDYTYTQYTLSGVMASGNGSDLTFAFTNLPSFIDLTDIVVTP